MAPITSDRRKLFSLRGINYWPLSFAQERLWFLDQLEGGGAVYNVSLAVRLSGELNAAALRAALTEVVRRHEVLRTTFAIVNGRLVQVVSPARDQALPLVELRQPGVRQREMEAQRLAVEEARQPFDLEKGPLLRARLLRLEEQEHVVLLTMHHIISDGWSRAVFVKELGKLYEQYNAVAEAGLKPLPFH